MPTIEELSIHLGQDPSIPFSPGQTISGVVRLNLSSELKLRNLKLDFKGHGKTQFSERHHHHTSNGNQTRTIWYTAKEIYLQGTNILYPQPGENPGDSHHLAAGNHEYAFQLTLPTSVPPTFQSSHGKIRYSVKVQVDRPWRIDTKTKLPFFVRGGANLNTLPNMQAQMQTAKAKQLTSMFGSSKGLIEAIVTVARPAFVIGEDMGLQVLVKNQSSTEIKKISAELLARVAVYGKHVGYGKTKVHTEKLAVTKTEQVIPPSSEQVIRFDNFVIPPNASTTFRTGIITVDHFINVAVDPAGMHFDLDVGMPIIIGATPLVQQAPPMQPNGIFTQKSVDMTIEPTFPSAPPLEPSEASGSFGGTSYIGLPPPSYNDAMSTNK